MFNFESRENFHSHSHCTHCTPDAAYLVWKAALVKIRNSCVLCKGGDSIKTRTEHSTFPETSLNWRDPSSYLLVMRCIPFSQFSILIITLEAFAQLCLGFQSQNVLLDSIQEFNFSVPKTSVKVCSYRRMVFTLPWKSSLFLLLYC